MMGHVATDNGDPLAFRQPDGSEIECFVKPETAQGTFPLQSPEVFHSSMGQVHGSQSGGVGGNHQILAQTPFQTQSGYAKSRILISEIKVAGIECRL